MNLILYLYRQSARLLALASITGALGGLASAGLVILINRGLADPQQLPGLALGFFGLCAGMLLSKLCSELSLLHLTQSAIFQMRIDLSRKLLATPLKRLQGMGKHRLLVILTEDVHTFTAAFEWVPLLFVNAVVTLACFAYLAWLSWSLLAILALFLLVGLVAFHLAERGPLGHLEKVRQQKDVLYQHFRSLIEGSKELQLNNARGEAFVERVIRPGADEFRLRFLRGMAGYSVVANLGTLLFYLNLGVLLFVVPFWLPQSPTVLVSFTVTLLYLVRPISDLMIALPSLRQASIALTRIRQLDAELSSEEKSAEEKATAPKGNPFAGEGPMRLQLNGVCHRYPGEHEDHPFMLGPVDLTLEQGELVFVVGGNGSGKTTLSMLLLGLYAPESGCVLFNGVQVNDDNREQYRQHFAAVFADFHLFEHLLGDEGPDAEHRTAEATRYVKALGLGHKVSIVDDRFSTVDLSTGQRKRLALVSAYLDDKPFYLFDEWAADQDPTFKRVFYMELLPELKARGKTVIVITHDDAYFQQADRVLKVENGRLTQVEAHAAYA